VQFPILPDLSAAGDGGCGGYLHAAVLSVRCSGGGSAAVAPAAAAEGGALDSATPLSVAQWPGSPAALL
jgi:hypothetical protein